MKPKPYLTRRETIGRLREVARWRIKPLLSADLVALDDHLWRSAMHHFGSFVAARRAAGLQRPRYRQKWTRELLLEELRKVDRRGIRVGYDEMTEAGYGWLLMALHKYLGGLRRAREVAGIEPPPPRVRDSAPWTREQVLRAIKAKRRQGEPLAFSRVEPHLRRGAVHVFGSWRAAIEAAGIEYASVALRQHSFTEDELLDIVRDLHRRFPTITLTELHRRQRHGNILRQRLGSIDRAVKLAGITGWPLRLHPGRALSKDAVIAGLRRRARGGQSCSYNALREEAPALITGADRHFGGLAAAVRTAGLPGGYAAYRARQSAAAIERLRERARRGLSMARTDVSRTDPTLVGRAKFHFGSWAAALAAAGIGKREVGRGG